MQNPASLRSDGWQLCSGPGGSLHVEWVAGFSGILIAARFRFRQAFKDTKVFDYYKFYEGCYVLDLSLIQVSGLPLEIC